MSFIAELMRFLKDSSKASLFLYALVFNVVILSLLIVLAAVAKFAPGYQGKVIISLFEESFTRARPYEGLLTTVSEILWCIPTTISWFMWLLIKNKPSAKQFSKFMLASAIVMTVFLADDLFRLTLMAALYAKIPKLLAYLFYGGLVAAYVIHFFPVLRKTPYFLLILTVVCLGFSGGIDLLHLTGQGLPVMLEDGSKLIGLLNLTLYFWYVSLNQFNKVFDWLDHNRRNLEHRA